MTPPDGAALEAVSAGSDTDPLDSFTLDDIQPDTGAEDEGNPQIPEANILGNEPADATKAEKPKAKPEPGEIEQGKDESVDIEDGQPRGKDGKFASKQAEEAAVATKVESIPFKYRAMGQTHDLEGSTLNDKGDLTIPAAKVQEAREAFNALHVLKQGTLPKLTQLETAVRDRDAKIAELSESRSLSEHRADEMVKALETLFTNPNEEAATQAFFKMRDEYPSLRAKSETEYWKTQAERASKRPETAAPSATRDAASTHGTPSSLPAREEAIATTKSHLEAYKVEHDYRDMTAEDWKQLEADCDGTPYAFVRPATAQDAKDYGVQVGEAVYDTDLLHAAVTKYVTGVRKQRETAATQTRRAADAAVRTQPKITAPPVPGSSAGKSKAAKTAAFSSKQEFNDWLDSDEI